MLKLKCDTSNCKPYRPKIDLRSVKKIAFLFLWFYGFLPVVAQRFIVTDSSGLKLEEAAILIIDAEGKKFFTVTGNDGKAVSNYKLSYPASAEVSMLGFFPKKIILNPGEPVIRVSLATRSYRLEEVIVTGQSAPVTVNETMQDASVISKEKMQLMAAAVLESIMQYESSSAISRDPVLGSNLSLRGLSGNNIKYLIDGVSVTGRMNGFVDLSQLSIENARQVEIINGPMAVNYGSDAHGGVINIITTGKKASMASFSGLAETTGRYNTSATAAYASGHSNLSIYANREFFEGWNEMPESRWKQWKPKTQYHAGVNVSHRFSHLNLSASSDFMDEKISNKGEPVITPYYAYALDDYYVTRRWMNCISSDLMIQADTRLKSVLSYSLFNRNKNRYRKDLVTLLESLTDQEGQDTSMLNALHFRTDYSFKTAGKKISILTGTEANLETADGKRTGGKRSEYHTAVYGTAEYQIREKIRIMPGIRMNYFSNETYRLIPALSIRYDATGKLFFRGNYSMGFRQPSLKEKFMDFQDVNHYIIGNEWLKPESSQNFTLSVHAENQSGKFLLSAVTRFYFTFITDMITLAQINTNNLIYSYINIGNYRTQGASLSWNAKCRMLTISSGFSMSGVKDNVNDKILYSPGANGSVMFTHEKTGINAGMFIRWSGRSYLYTTSDAGVSSLKQGAFTLAETSVSKSFFRNRMTLQTGIKNLLDIKRVETTGTGGIHSGDNLPAGTGRSYYVKLALSTGK